MEEKQARPAGVRIIVAGTGLDLLEQLESRLIQHGHRVGKVASMADLLRQLVHYEPSLVVLLTDHPSPVWDAKEACHRVREVSQTFIMAITHEGEILEMLKAGADDCLAQPIDWDEFMARVDALLRRTNKRKSPGNAPSIIAEAGLWINFDTQEVNLHGEDLVLTEKEFRLLGHLVQHRARVVPCDRLLAVLGNDDENTRHASLRDCIHRLREKIERDPSNPQAIVTHRGIGYAFHTDGLWHQVNAGGRPSEATELMGDDASGLRRVEDIHKAKPGLPVILASGLHDSIGRILSLGVEAWIDEPFPLGEVRAAVKKVPG